MIKTFQEFILNEDATADLIQQKNSLSQQINDLQKKLLDVQAQIVNAQKQTLSQNPQSQIPMGESLDNGGINPSKKVIDTFYSKEGGMRGKLVIEFNTPSSDGEGNEGEVFDVRNFEGFVEDFVRDQYEQEDVAQYFRRDADGEGYYTYFSFDDFWGEIDDPTKNEIAQAYLQKHGLM